MGNQVPADPVFLPAQANETNRTILIDHHGRLRRGSTETACERTRPSGQGGWGRQGREEWGIGHGNLSSAAILD